MQVADSATAETGGPDGRDDNRMLPSQVPTLKNRYGGFLYLCLITSLVCLNVSVCVFCAAALSGWMKKRTLPVCFFVFYFDFFIVELVLIRVWVV